MSRMTLKKITNNGDVVKAAEFHNAWLFQPFVWDILAAKAGIINKGYGMEHWTALWEWAGNGEPLEWFEWNTLVFGYDHILVRRYDLDLLVDSLRAFHDRHGTRSPHNHCLAIADAIEARSVDVEGFGIWGTSVADDPWSVYNDETDEYRPYNINIDDGHKYAIMKGKGETND